VGGQFLKNEVPCRGRVQMLQCMVQGQARQRGFGLDVESAWFRISGVGLVYPVLAGLDEQEPRKIPDEVGVGALFRDSHVPVVKRAREEPGEAVALVVEQGTVARSGRVRLIVQGSRFRVQGSGSRVQGSGFRVQGSGFRVQG